MKQVINQGAQVLQQLGMDAFNFYLKESLVMQLKAKADELGNRALDPSCLNIARKSNHTLGIWRSRLEDLAARAPMAGAGEFPSRSNKLEALLRLLGGDACRGKKGIVFVERVVMCFPLAEGLLRVAGITACPVSGVGSMPDAVRAANMELFRSGQAQAGTRYRML